MPDVPNLSDLRTVDWSKIEPRELWTHIVAAPSPPTTRAPRRGERRRAAALETRLSPAFVEHLMGLPPGWVTNLPLPRTAQLRALGNGVVPQQAAYAVSLLLADLATLTATERPDFGQKLNAA
jgi:DNA (cytosine-5)-methyltransferase 1